MFKRKKKFKIEKVFKYKDYECVIVGFSLGHRCGYVGISKNHRYYGKDYDDLQLYVHGGLTYSKLNPEFSIKSDKWWIGFDCMHREDGKDFDLIRELSLVEEYEYILDLEKRFPTGGIVRTIDFVENECKKLIDQLEEAIK